MVVVEPQLQVIAHQGTAHDATTAERAHWQEIFHQVRIVLRPDFDPALVQRVCKDAC